MGDRPSPPPCRQGHVRRVPEHRAAPRSEGVASRQEDRALVAEAEKLHKQVDQYAYGPPTFRFDPSDTDQARAAGVLIELDGGNPIITDPALYRELAKQAIARTVEQLRDRAAAKASGRRASTAKRERTPREEVDTEHRATLRELTRQAHGTNLDLGTKLLTELPAGRARQHGRGPLLRPMPMSA